MTRIPGERIWQAIAAQRSQVGEMFDTLRADSVDGRGVTRDTYGPGEDRAHAYLAKVGREDGFEVTQDLAANTFITLFGADRSAPQVIIGSHLDSVREGGNFDGAAGVLAGLFAMRTLRALGIKPRCNITTMAVRAEESVWFQISYIGSRAALGTLPPAALDAKRIDTGLSLAEHISSSGGEPGAIRNGVRSIEKESARAFLEVHIEQAPSLVEADKPVGICTAIPGNFRYPSAEIIGEYAHVGLPRRFRRDAVIAASDLVGFMDRLWEEFENAGKPMACTFGRFHTDASTHALTTVAGRFQFSLDVRAYHEDHLKEIEDRFLAFVDETERVRRVKIDLGPRASAPVGRADQKIREQLAQEARRLNIPSMALGSPASHDSAAFAAAGIPMAMLFIRNRNGSHNPFEAMDIDDFLKATAILTSWLAANVCASEEPSRMAAIQR